MIVIKQLFLNVCIYVTMLFIGSQVFKDKDAKKQVFIKETMQTGICNGIFGIVLMIFSVQIAPQTILDFRALPIIAGAIYSSTASVIITGVIMAVFRAFYLGFSTYSLLKAVCVLIMAFVCAAVSKTKASKQNKWIAMFIFTGIIYSASLTLFIKDRAILETAFLYYWIGGIFSNAVVYMISEYLARINWTLERLQKEATQDYLTGLNNVRCFDNSFNKLLNVARNKDESVGLLIIDIDFFKKVNDTYGHASGDMVLKQLGEIMINSVRDFDVIARIGGEEFGVILRDCSEIRSTEIAERIRRNVEQEAFVLSNGEVIKITISIGIAVYPATVADIDMLKEKADEKLYEAKHSGRNRACI